MGEALPKAVKLKFRAISGRLRTVYGQTPKNHRIEWHVWKPKKDFRFMNFDYIIKFFVIVRWELVTRLCLVGEYLPGCHVDEGDISSRQLKKNEAIEIKLDEQISIKSILILLKINQSCQLKA